jgi:hypothetical protein
VTGTASCATRRGHGQGGVRMIKLLATIALLATTPALAQGVTNNRDANGNLSRDKGVSASTMQRRALVSGAVDQSGRPASILIRGARAR